MALSQLPGFYHLLPFDTSDVPQAVLPTLALTGSLPLLQGPVGIASAQGPKERPPSYDHQHGQPARRSACGSSSFGLEVCLEEFPAGEPRLPGEPQQAEQEIGGQK